LALDSSNSVYVVDRNNERIQKFDNGGNFITMWSAGQFQQPVGIATDSLNNIYVTAISNGANIAIKFNSEGTLIKSWFVASPNPNADTQNAIAVDSSNNVYISSNNRIFKFTSEGTFIKSWGSEGTSDGQFRQIVGIGTDSSNNVYVTDKYNLRVEKFTSEGTFIKSWGSDCQGASVFCSEPQGIAIDSSNNVYVTEYNAGRVSKFTIDGSPIQR
jgi:tripartite motif-containing protein 71